MDCNTMIDDKMVIMKISMCQEILERVDEYDKMVPNEDKRNPGYDYLSGWMYNDNKEGRWTRIRGSKISTNPHELTCYNIKHRVTNIQNKTVGYLYIPRSQHHNTNATTIENVFQDKWKFEEII